MAILHWKQGWCDTMNYQIPVSAACEVLNMFVFYDNHI
mgnify:CR=1 FL=1